MHPKVLGPDAWSLVRRLASERVTAGWTLAGGTGLALHIGHRFSDDLDFFRFESFEVPELTRSLSEIGRVSVQGRAEGTLHAVVDGIRLSFLRAEAPLLFNGTPYRGITIADPQDIVVTKIVAIGGRGNRKDFVDLYFYLRGGGSLETAFELLRRRFTLVDYNEYHLMKSLVFFDDAEREPMPRMLREVAWDDVKKTIITEVRRL